MNRRKSNNKRSSSVPPSFKYHSPDFTQPVVDESIVYTYLPKQNISVSLYWTLVQKAVYKMFPDAVEPFLHSYNDQPSVIQRSYRLNMEECKHYWHKKNKIHRDGNDKPALVTKSGLFHKEAFYQNDQLHRDFDKPSQILVRGNYVYHQYFWRGKLHRWSGPADSTFTMNSNGEVVTCDAHFWLFGKKCSNINEFWNLKFDFITKDTEQFSTIYDIVVPHIQTSLQKLNQQNSQFYRIPDNVVFLIHSFWKPKKD